MLPITILIPTYNRAASLEAVWPCYVSNGLVEKIVVVNDGSTDGTSDLVRRLEKSSSTKVQLIEHSKCLGQQTSRISAIAEAQTEWILFGEDDVWLAPDYCSTLLCEAHRLGADIIAGRLVTVRVPNRFYPELIQDNLSGPGQEDPVFDMSSLTANFAIRATGPVEAPHLHTIALIRRSIFDHMQFDTRYRGNAAREETDFYLSARTLGYRLYFTPATACYHLRGPVCRSGGQRTNRLAFEYFTIRNTLYLVSKHWSLLKREHGFKGTPFTWTVGFSARRAWRQLSRVLRGDYKSSLKGF